MVTRVNTPRNARARTAIAAAAVIIAIAGLTASAGCGGTCATNCPNLLFQAMASPGENLDVKSAQWAGPACPPEQPSYCAPDPTSGRTCVFISMLGTQAGTCQLDLTFNDGRAPFRAIAEFGPETHQGCCHGFPVLGTSAVTIPPLHPQADDAGVDSAPGSDALPDTGITDLAAGDAHIGSSPDSGNQ
jgi:hypothetical protein